jgi:hypothetical protein
MSAALTTSLKRDLELAFEMVTSQIDVCPDSLWTEKAGGFCFWQQILHALTGALYWTHDPAQGFEEPYKEKNLFIELDGEPEGSVTKDELREVARKARAQIAALFAGRDDSWLSQPSLLYDKVSNADIVLGQIRHLMYHSGHCDSALRDRNLSASPWLEYRGEE